MPSSSEIIYTGSGFFENKKQIIDLITNKKIKFNYFYSKNFKTLPFDIYPFYLIRKDRKKGFFIKGDNIILKIYDDEKFIGDFKIKKVIILPLILSRIQQEK